VDLGETFPQFQVFREGVYREDAVVPDDVAIEEVSGGVAVDGDEGNVELLPEVERGAIRAVDGDVNAHRDPGIDKPDAAEVDSLQDLKELGIVEEADLDDLQTEGLEAGGQGASDAL
jgi:predicted transcriptional regulator